MNQFMHTTIQRAFKKSSSFFSLCLTIMLCTACPGPGPQPPKSEVLTVYLNQRLEITFSATNGTGSLVLNGKQVKASNLTFTDSSVFFNVTVENLGGEYVEEADAVVRVNGSEVVRKRLKILDEIFASSELVVFTKNLDQSELETQLKQLNSSASLKNGFSLTPESFRFVEQSGSGTALINIGDQTTEEALDNLKSLGLDADLNASPNLLYSISRRKGVYWTSPRCELLDELDQYAAQDWKLLKRADLFGLLGVDKAGEQDLKGAGIIIPILDTGINDGDIFDCDQTVFKEGHGTHIFNFANDVAEEATVSSESICDAEGFCSTESFVNMLIELENRYLTSGKKVIINLSVSGSRGLDDSIDRAIWAQLKYYEEKYPNFLAIAAAGNHGLSDDLTISNSPAYPASFSDAVPQTKEYAPLRNVISVGSVGVRASTDKVEVSAANPKDVPVDILAPGIRVCWEDEVGACAPNRGSEGLTGSSFATALVSGVAAIMWSACEEMNAQELRALLIEQGKPVEGSTYKLLNADPSFVGNEKCKGLTTDRLEAGTQQSGTLSDLETKDYKFNGFFNTPLLFTVNRGGDLYVRLEVVDSRGKLTRLDWNVFTPEANGEYTLRIMGLGAGTYTIFNDYAAGPPEGRNIVKDIVLDQRFDGRLADEAFDDYILKGFVNVPLLFNVITETCLQTRIYDVRNVETRPTGEFADCRSYSFTFTPTESSDYRLRFIGYREPGDYSLYAEVAPPQ